MRFIRGRSLQHAIEDYLKLASKGADASQQHFEFRQLLRRFVDVCNAIHYAHSRGIIHRDIKPGNVMLGDFGETLVVDWGIAKSIKVRGSIFRTALGRLPQLLSGDGSQTMMGSAIGTPQFMSPEQAEGRLDELGSLEAAEHLTFCDYCLARYTALIESAPEKLKQPMRDLIPQVQALMRLRSFRIMTNRYVSTAAAVMLAFALWRFGFFGGVGTVQKPVQQLPDVTPRVTVSQALGGMFDSMSSGLSNMFDGMQLTINSGLAQLADPVVPHSNPTNNGGSPAHGE